MTLDHLLIVLVVGLIAGFAASHLVAGRGFGMIGDIVVGIVGAFLGAWLFGLIGITAGSLLAEIVVAFLGACILIAIVRLVTGGRRFSRRRGIR
jgi:uncharacterized membrane protein YeaQ/YmgE (transglycosylase-associated protein family)